MGDMVVERLKYGYGLRHRWVLNMIEEITEEQFAWKPTPTSHSIAWNLWHLARWADYLQAKIPTMTPSLARKLGPVQQIWTQEDLAARWELDSSVLGWGETGMERTTRWQPRCVFLAKRRYWTMRAGPSPRPRVRWTPSMTRSPGRSTRAR